MIYSATLTRTGQITVPKGVREIIGIKPGQKVIFEKKGDKVVLSKRVSDEEFFAEIDQIVGKKAKKIATKDKNKPVSKMIKELASTPEARARLEDEYD